MVEIRQSSKTSTPTTLASLIAGNTSMGAATPVGPNGSAFTPYTAPGTPRGSTPDLGQVAPSDKQAFMCPVCGKQFGQPYNLRRHLTTHTGERPYRCPHCNYAASQNVHLEKHIRRIHLNNGQNSSPHGDDDDGEGDSDGMRGGSGSLSSPNGPPLLTPISQARQCQLCLVTLANANLLRRHVEDHHFHIRKYDCAHCGKKFKRKEHKERHERIHTGEKPFACYICNARFTQKEHLKGHIENVHHKHGEKGLEGLGDYDRDLEDRDEDEDIDVAPSSSSPPPPQPSSSTPSPSLAPVSSLISLASAASPLTSILPAPALLPSTSSPSSSSLSLVPSSTLSSDLNMNQFTALYAPVTRKTVNSPNKHMQTITINFN